MSNFQVNKRYDHYNNDLTTQLLNHLTMSELRIGRRRVIPDGRFIAQVFPSGTGDIQ